jgi:glucosamine--fructose-6-phosphate aminotransferase (isomerizing)
MCGIVGYIGNKDSSQPIIHGLKLLQNRGYDSAGVSTIQNGELKTIKFASTSSNNSIQQIEESIQSENTIFGNIGIGHTRWATHGGKTDENAHPHNDSKNRISIVHNGIIENFYELKQDLLHEGFHFHSQTDTEVVSILIGKFLDEGLCVEESIKKTLKKLHGTWAFVIIHKDYPNKIWITRNGSPLLLGIDDNFAMIVSEQIAFGNNIQKYISINNHDLFEITRTQNGILLNKDINQYNMNDKTASEYDSVPQGFPYWMLKEIMEQPESINRAINNGGRIYSNSSVKLGGLDTCSQELLELEHIIILGCGTSYHAGLWSTHIFKSLDCFHTVSVYDGAEFHGKDIPRRGKTGLILLSQSGETKDLHRCINIAKDHDLITIGVVNTIDSMIARETNCGVYLNAGREVAVASTKSFTNQCIVLTMIAIWFSQNRNTCLEKRKTMIHDLRNISYHMECLFERKEHIIQIVENIIENRTKYKTESSIFILGKGKSEAIAKEGALKIKEVAYLHADGYSSSALKHGTFALIEKGLPIVILDIDDEYREKNRNAYQEVMARNANVIVITDLNENIEINSTSFLLVEKNNTFGSLLANVYLQFMGYYLAIHRNINPDYPRNLAKVVTVE